MSGNKFLLSGHRPKLFKGELHISPELNKEMTVNKNVESMVFDALKSTDRLCRDKIASIAMEGSIMSIVEVRGPYLRISVRDSGWREVFSAHRKLSFCAGIPFISDIIHDFCSSGRCVSVESDTYGTWEKHMPENRLYRIIENEHLFCRRAGIDPFTPDWLNAMRSVLIAGGTAADSMPSTKEYLINISGGW